MENEAASQVDLKLWSMLCHLSALLVLVGIPFANILAPLLIWQIKKQDLPGIEHHGKEALNFQITATLIFLVLSAGVFTSLFLTMILIGFIMLPIVGLLILAASILWIVYTIVASVKANEGEKYRYPWTIRFIR